MSNDKLLTRIEEVREHARNNCADSDIGIWAANALRAVVWLIQEKQMFLEETKGDIPMTSQQLGAREERTKLLVEIKQAIEGELK